MCNEHRKTYAWYDMEQHIMKCWDVVTDLGYLGEEDERLKAFATVYEMRFQKLWEAYEAATEERFEERKKRGNKE